MGCHPECYTKGRGCVVSSDGKCLIEFAREGEPKYTVNNFIKNLDNYIKEAWNLNSKKISKTKKLK